MNSTNAAAHAEIQAEHIDTLFRSIPIAIIVHTVTGAILVFLLQDTISHDTLLTWLIVLYGLTIARWFLMRFYQRRHPPLETVARWGMAAAVLSWIFGLTWAAVPILFVDPSQPETVIIITIILVALNAQALMAVVSYPPAYFASVLTLLSLIAVMLLRGGELGIDIAVLISLNLVASLFYARNVYQVLSHSLRLRFENMALQRETEEKSTLLETTLQHIQQGISLIDRENRLRMWNRQFLDLLRLNDRELSSDRNFTTLLNSVTPGWSPGDHDQTEYRRADGAVIEIRQNLMPDGGRVLTYTDISELKQREEALELARQEAERANSAKTRFLATASHDLRQPIHALGLFFANLAEGVRAPDTEPLINQIETSIEAIDSMLNALLDISKLDAGVVRPHIGPVALVELFDRLRHEYQPLAQETGNRLRVRPSQGVVLSDLAMLERILRNLLTNALRYTSRGQVLMGARRRGNRLQIEIHDTGFGVPEDQLEDIFLEFHQLSNPARDRHQGLGLGLAIVKRLVALLGHQITVRSRLGRGSCFTVTLPVVREAAYRATASPTALPSRELQGRRILVLDDDGAVLEAMDGLLKRWGCVVIKAASLEEARERMATVAPPELLIVDYRLRGDVSGLDVVALLQEELRRYIPALIITGDTAPYHLRQAEASGYPLLHKPVHPAKLRGAVRHLLRTHERGVMD